MLSKRDINEKLAIYNRDLDTPVNNAMPMRIFINTTNKCNLECLMCPNNIKGEMKRELPFKTFNKLAKELFPLAKEYHTTVSGEPLLTTYFKRIIVLLKKYKIRLNMTTNGMLLNEEVIKGIIPLLNDIKISFDGAKKETFERLRRGAKYDIVIENIKKLVNMNNSYIRKKNHKIKPTITLQTTLMLSNIKELLEIVKIAKALGVDRVKAYLMIAYNEETKKESLWFHKELTNSYIKKAKKLATKLNIQTKFPKEILSQKRESKKDGRAVNICHFLWQEFWVDEKGNVTPCCNITAPILGNVYKESPKRIWNNKKYQQIRKALNSNTPFECCKHCALIHEFKDDEWSYEYNSLIVEPKQKRKNINKHFLIRT